MSTKEPPDATSESKILSSDDFLNFLAKQSISQLTVTTVKGDRYSAKFDSDQSAVFKSIDALKSLTSQDSATSGNKGSNVFCEYYKKSSTIPNAFPSNDWKSTDWHSDYAKSHVDVSYTNCFAPGSSQKAGLSQSSVLPPKKRGGKTDWKGMFDDALSPLVEAAEMHSQAVAADGAKKPPPKNRNDLPKQSKRKPRKIIPVNKEYINEYSDTDILFGRGGRSNHHHGNKIYRDIVTERQPYYRTCDKNEKTKVAQEIVDTIQRTHNGRFLELDKVVSRWYIVPNIVARRKVGQALRENNTEEARAAKREKYGHVKPKEEA
jgi:hypothetical protein